jgi:hypothetical protein
MKRHLYYKFVVLLFFAIVQTASADTWARFVGSGFWDTAAGFTKTRDGGFLLAGAAFGPDNHDRDPLLIKFDSQGSVKWQKTFSVQGYIEQALSVEKTHDGGFVITGGYGVTKITNSGNVQWSRRFKKVFPYFARGVSDHGSVVVGYRNFRPWVGKLDPSGVMQWEFTYSCGIQGEVANTILETSDGNLLVGALTYCKAPYGGVELVKVDQKGDVLWHKVYSNSNSNIVEPHYLLGISETHDSGYIVALNAAYRLKIMKLDPQGNVVWNQLFGIDVGDSLTPTEIQQTQDGGYIFVHGNNLLKLNDLGEPDWHYTYGRRRATNLVGVSQQKDGTYVIGGAIRQASRGMDFVVLKVDGNGNLNSPCIKARDRSVTVTPGTIEVFSDTALHIRSVKSAAKDLIVTPFNFVSDQKSCN